jgi:hypothetical protein
MLGSVNPYHLTSSVVLNCTIAFETPIVAAYGTIEAYSYTTHNFIRRLLCAVSSALSASRR